MLSAVGFAIFLVLSLCKVLIHFQIRVLGYYLSVVLLNIRVGYVSRMREERRKANFDRRLGRRGIRASEKPEEVDDIASWVNKSRQLDEKKKAEEREKAARMAKALEEQVG